ncbi:Serine/threonine-protein kinase Pkn6 [Archangium gephyra]|uniref:Serine/threonine-protein kinase Pkn6 n=1 Tax=Archangium gephyra TaxID=48 RepID=A0AAC8QHI3_9BACT|nr:Serine/threonine-protein kinase Pkn6 [Archangium gephyra]
MPFGRYTLLSQLATGGMGEIFLARLEGAQGFEKLCVIKKILPQLAADPEFVERFVGEARTLVKLSHGSIAQVLDMGLHEGDAYMALEYVDGKDLRKVAARARDRQKPLPLTFVLFVMGRVLDALAYAHRKKGDDEGELNLVHRDISPQNILISYEGEVKVIDFGLAKSRLSAAKTNPSIILGKFLYMSPEQARHQPVDRRSDLYAVGLCLYELISGRNPFDLLPPGELMSAVAQPTVQPLGEVVPSAPPAVTQLVMKALAVDPAQRFQTAEELRGKLNACLLELDPSSGPESVSRYMHELFGPEYQGERRLLASLREAARPPEPESGGMGAPEGGAPRLSAEPSSKTGRPEGSFEPLSFRPTPRTREGAPVRDDGETRPAVPTSSMDEPTRPAVAVEAIEESRKERLSPPGGSPTVDISGLSAPVAPRSPAPAPVAPRAPAASPVLSAEPGSGALRAAGASLRPSPQPGAMPSAPRVPLTPAIPVSGSMAPTRELVASSGPGAPHAVPMAEQALPEDLGPVRIEDTPMWSEPLRSDEDLSAIEPSSDSRPAPPLPYEAGEQEAGAWESQPGWEASGQEPDAAPEEDEGGVSTVTGEALGDSEDIGLADTNPRMQRPSGHEDTQPRVVLQDVYRQDTQPRVVLDESLTRDSDEEVSQGGKTKRPRRRVTSTGTPVVSPRPTTGSTPRMAPVTARNHEEREAPNSRRVEAEPPVRPEITRRTSVPARPFPWGLLTVVVILLLVGGGLSAAVFMQAPHEEAPVEPPPARPLFQEKKAAQAPAPAAGEPPAVADSAPAASAANTENPGTPAPAPVPDTAPAEALAAAPGAAPGAAPTGDTSAPVGELSPDESLLAPLAAPSSATASASSKRQVQRKRTSSRGQSMLQKEWVRTRTAYKALTRIYACESLDLLCSRYEDLESEVVGMGDVESAELLGKVRALQREIQRRKKGS